MGKWYLSESIACSIWWGVVITVTSEGWCWVIWINVCHLWFLISNLCERCTSFSWHVWCRDCFESNMMLFDFVEDKTGRLVYVASGMEANWEIPAPLLFNAGMYSLLVVSKVWCSWLLCRSHPAAYMEQTVQKGCFSVFFLLHWSRENHPATLWRLVVMGVVTKGVRAGPPHTDLSSVKSGWLIALLSRPRDAASRHWMDHTNLT